MVAQSLMHRSRDPHVPSHYLPSLPPPLIPRKILLELFIFTGIHFDRQPAPKRLPNVGVGLTWYILNSLHPSLITSKDRCFWCGGNSINFMCVQPHYCDNWGIELLAQCSNKICRHLNPGRLSCYRSIRRLFTLKYNFPITKRSLQRRSHGQKYL